MQSNSLLINCSSITLEGEHKNEKIVYWRKANWTRTKRQYNQRRKRIYCVNWKEIAFSMKNEAFRLKPKRELIKKSFEWKKVSIAMIWQAKVFSSNIAKELSRTYFPIVVYRFFLSRCDCASSGRDSGVS